MAIPKHLPLLRLAVLLTLLSMNTLNAQSEPSSAAQHPHPRVLVSAQSWKEIADKRREDVLLDRFLRQSEREARGVLSAEPVKYEKEGRRLLHVSRRALRRILLLSFHFRLTGEFLFARRAEREMLAAAAFSDWNPSHFLDVAEMTAALAIGYDWLFADLSTRARTAIRQAIVEKGLRPGIEPNHGWLKNENNWNQVCLAGLTMGALAVAEDEPQLAAQVLEMVQKFNHYGLHPYAPDGVYPEGPTYWAYGTSFQVLLLASLQSAIGTDWGLAQSPGFLKSAEGVLQMTAPGGRAFNFSDGVEPIGIEPALFWFTHQLKQPELLQFQWPLIEQYSTREKLPDTQTEEMRLLPLAALWWPSKAERVASGNTLPLQWTGRGENPLGVFRSRWGDANAMYLGFKGGTASASHGHMDAGSFVFEAGGVRWARDLGMQNYNSLESKGVQLWNAAQDGERWKVFRLNNFSHNTLTINDELHRVNGHAEITHFSGAAESSSAILDLSQVFTGQAQKVRRGFSFHPASGVLVRDELEGLKFGDVVRWAMVTSAAVEVNGREAVLQQAGQRLHARLVSTPDAKFEVIAADPPKDDFNAPNPDTRILFVKAIAPASGALQIAVQLQLENSSGNDSLAGTSLDRWPTQPVK
jgi:hypothetical protein